jgi:hypothetical protein
MQEISDWELSPFRHTGRKKNSIGHLTAQREAIKANILHADALRNLRPVRQELSRGAASGKE